MPEWKIHVRGADLRREAEVDDFAKLELVVRHNHTGTWLLDLPAGTAAAGLLASFSAGLVCVRDDRTILSGPVTGIDRNKSANDDTLTVSGVDDSVWLDRRQALPVPAGPPYPSAYDIRTGPAETVLRGYVDANIGPGARPERAVAGLTLAADQARGRAVTGRARFGAVSGLLRPLATVAGLGYRIVQVGNALVFEVYEPADLTATAIFSEEFGNLAGFTYQARAAQTNHVIAAGGGEGAARTFVEGGDSASIVRYGRIEAFKDQRHTSDLTELQQAVEEQLADGAEQVGLSLSPVDTDALGFGRDYNVGDRVTVMVDGRPIRDVLREVKVTYDGGGETVTPTVGTPEGPRPRTVLAMFDRMRRLSARVSGLETRS